jgi:hypothetical protein
MAQQHLTLYLKLFQMTKYFYGQIKNFPREYKYTLGQEIINLCWRCLDQTVRANARPRDERHVEIKKLNVFFICLKLRLRMAQEINILSARQYVHIQSNYIQEAGRMIGGWQKWADKLKQD